MFSYIGGRGVKNDPNWRYVIFGRPLSLLMLWTFLHHIWLKHVSFYTNSLQKKKEIKCCARLLRLQNQESQGAWTSILVSVSYHLTQGYLQSWRCILDKTISHTNSTMYCIVIFNTSPRQPQQVQRYKDTTVHSKYILQDMKNTD